MRIKRLLLENFGPFKRYDIPFVDEEPACILLTGKNNEGKSNIILALKMLSSACRSISKRQLYIVVNEDEYFKLPQQDIEGIRIGRLLHNYAGGHAKIEGTFDNNFKVVVHLDESEDLIYAEYIGQIPSDVTEIFGFIPPLGPIAETEEFLSKKHILMSINTSLAPRHLRNHLVQVLDTSEYAMVQAIVETTWPGIKLLKFEHDHEDNMLKCFFREDRIMRELAWAGQGLQVWFQIITHLIRLRNTSVLILDEPEINLHAEKQNDLIQVLKEQHKGSVIIATHSIELMNNVDVSHIIHVQKKTLNPIIKKTTDRTYLNLVRSKVGSNFNLIASQFDTFDLILFTEDTNDFKFLQNLAKAFKFKCNVFNIPLHGFSEYPKAISYQEAYNLLIGGNATHTVLLDRDYYPEEYLKKVKKELAGKKISVLFTPGKEIENIFLLPSTIQHVIPKEHLTEFETFWDNIFQSEKLEAYGSYNTLHQKFLAKKIDLKTLTTRFTPLFEERWANKKTRHLIIEGKKALGHLRSFYRDKTGRNLTTQMLIQAIVKGNDTETISFVGQVLGCQPRKKQMLHY